MGPKPAAKTAEPKAEAKAAKPKAEPKATAKAEPKVEAPEQKVVHKNSLEELELNLQQHVDGLVKLVVPKLKEATAKQASSKFLNDSLKSLSLKLTLAETEQLQK